MIRVVRRTRDEAGSCNACSARDYVLVFEIHLGPSLVIRLCTECWMNLKAYVGHAAAGGTIVPRGGKR